MHKNLEATVLITFALLVSIVPGINSEYAFFPFSNTQNQSVNITYPQEDMFLKGSVNITIEYNGGEYWEENTSQWIPVPATEMVLKIDNVTVRTWTQELGFSGTVNYTWHTRDYQDGPHSLYVWQENAMGDTVSTEIEVNVDNTPPEAYVISPKPSSWVKGEVNITLHIKELGCMDRIDIYVDGKIQDSLSLDKPWDDPYDLPWSWHTCEFSDGKHMLKFVLYDQAGNSASLEVAYFVDNTAPKMKILSPMPGHWVREGEYLVLDLQDSGSGLHQLKIYVNQSLEYVATNTKWSNPYVVHWHWGDYPDGEITLLIKVYDSAGNVASTTASYNVDNTPPSLKVSAHNTTLRNTLRYVLNYSATDNFQVSHYLITIVQQTSQGTGLWKKINTTETNITLEFEDNATYTINVKAFDDAGNYAERTIIIKTDYNYPPKLVKSNVPETVKSGKVVSFYAQGKDVKGDALNYTWFIDGREVGRGHYLNISLAPGEHLLKLVIDDGFHNVSYTWIIVAQGERREEVPLSPFIQALLDWVLYLFLFIGLVILLTGALMMMKKKK